MLDHPPKASQKAYSILCCNGIFHGQLIAYQGSALKDCRTFSPELLSRWSVPSLCWCLGLFFPKAGLRISLCWTWWGTYQPIPQPLEDPLEASTALWYQTQMHWKANTYITCLSDLHKWIDPNTRQRQMPAWEQMQHLLPMPVNFGLPDVC